ncbi:hypothetical protein FQA39_LY03057 [Lamprigera yunnana]|nr:hypothetical protein FQA39_LY03057 [Lamprigera yunnana]
MKESVSPIPVPIVRKTIRETTENPDLLNGCNIQCTKSHTVNLVNDRTEILTEMNLDLKIETESLKHELKRYIERNNELNFEIANIETALEVYYKESKHQKSTISSIYSTIKNYSTNKTEDRERYTYKRIKAISDYVETLKSKLSHQDRIIKDNFLENPYSTDLMMKYDSVKQQLDKLSGDNQDLRNDIKKKQEEEIEIIKELNRQKFKVEEKCRELEVYYKNELSVKDAIIEDIQQQHKSEIEEMQTYLDQKNEEIQKIKHYYEAKDTNYKEELALVYQKWKTMENYNFPKMNERSTKMSNTRTCDNDNL